MELKIARDAFFQLPGAFLPSVTSWLTFDLMLAKIRWSTLLLWTEGDLYEDLFGKRPLIPPSRWISDCMMFHPPFEGIYILSKSEPIISIKLFSSIITLDYFPSYKCKIFNAVFTKIYLAECKNVFQLCWLVTFRASGFSHIFSTSHIILLSIHIFFYHCAIMHIFLLGIDLCFAQVC